jgi:hypothetical protein
MTTLPQTCSICGAKSKRFNRIPLSICGRRWREKTCQTLLCPSCDCNCKTNENFVFTKEERAYLESLGWYSTVVDLHLRPSFRTVAYFPYKYEAITHGVSILAPQRYTVYARVATSPTTYRTAVSVKFYDTLEDAVNAAKQIGNFC